MPPRSVDQKESLQVQDAFKRAVERIGSTTDAFRILSSHPTFSLSLSHAAVYRWLHKPIWSQYLLKKVRLATQILSEDLPPSMEEHYRALNLVELRKRVNRLQRVSRILGTEIERIIKVMAKLVLVIAPITLPCTARADSIGFYFGEQLAVTGSAADATINCGPISIVPWIFLDGSRFEGLVMVRYADSTNAVAFGPLLGSRNDPITGATPYFGAELRGKLGLGKARFLFRLAERHVREGMLNRFANLGLEAGSKKLAVRLSYQPIERQDVWTHRLAFKATTSHRNATIGLEVRSSLDATHRKGALVDLSVPLK